MSDLPVLEPLKPVAVCGFCNNSVYADGRCQCVGIQPDSCPLRGPEWQARRRILDQQNAAPFSMEQGMISDRLTNFDGWGNRVRDRD